MAVARAEHLGMTPDMWDHGAVAGPGRELAQQLTAYPWHVTGEDEHRPPPAEPIQLPSSCDHPGEGATPTWVVGYRAEATAAGTCLDDRGGQHGQ